MYITDQLVDTVHSNINLAIDGKLSGVFPANKITENKFMFWKTSLKTLKLLMMLAFNFC